jgi:hypothetical protein
MINPKVIARLKQKMRLKKARERGLNLGSKGTKRTYNFYNKEIDGFEEIVIERSGEQSAISGSKTLELQIPWLHLLW